MRLCRTRVEKEGWLKGEVYADHAISGATTLRPGYQQMLEDARASRFDVLVAEGLDRLSRDQEDIAGLFKQLTFAGVKLITLAEGEINELHVGLKGTMNALFLKDLALKIRRGQRGRVEAGFAAGGLSYGYVVVREVDQNGNLERGKRAICDEQASIVRRIFTEYASGKSPRKIAADLNREGIPAPRGGNWGASGINGHRGRRNGILQNELYKGLLIYNRVRMVKDPRTGKRISRINPKEEWAVVEVPHLRIVTDELWDRVQETRRSYSIQPIHRARRAKRLLSGLLYCGWCGGAYTIVRPGKYGCATHRGSGTCANPRQIMASELEKRVLSGVKRHLLKPEFLAAFADEFEREMQKMQGASIEEHANLEIELRSVSQRIRRLVDAIADGTDSPALREQLLELENQKLEFANRIESLKSPIVIEAPKTTGELFRRKVENLQESLNVDDETQHEAGSVLRSLIDSIVMHPGEKRGEIMIDVHGKPDIVFLMADRGSKLTDHRMTTMVAEEGLEPPTRGL